MIEVLGIFIQVFNIIIFPHLLQLRIDYIEGQFFKKVRIRSFGFLFTAMNTGLLWEKKNRKIIADEGIIVPMLFIQLLGYLLSIFLIIGLVVFLFTNLDLLLLLFISISVYISEVVVDLIVLLIIWKISQQRKRKFDEHYKKYYD